MPSVPLPGRSEYRLAYRIPASVKVKIRDFAPSLFHVASPDPLGYAAIRLAQKWNIPSVASYHARHDIYSHYYGFGFLAAPWQRYLRHLYAPCRQILAPSREIVELLKSEGIGKDIRLWSRGVDLTRFNPGFRSLEWRRSLGIADDEVVVAFIGRMVVEKNVGIVEQVSRLLMQRGVAHKLLFVGEGAERTRLQGKLANAVFTGFLDGDELSRAYASADIFFFPSITETFGIVTLEAMASGLPSVCADATGSASLVVPGETGYLVDEKDISGFTEAVARLIGSSDLRRQMGANAIARCRSFEWGQAMETVESYYREVLASSSSTAT